MVGAGSYRTCGHHSQRVDSELGRGPLAAAVGETNSLPYRLVYRAFRAQGIRHLSPTYVPHSDGCLYFEDQLTLRWNACVEMFRRFQTGPIPDDERAWAERKLKAIREGDSRLPFIDERSRGQEAARRRLGRVQDHVAAWRYARSAPGRSSPRAMPAEVLSPSARLRRLLAAKPRARFYDCLVHPDLPRQRFAAFFLHVQPETAVECLAFQHQDQVALIRNIVSILPASTVLLVKDHKFDAGRRAQAFYGELVSIPGVWLVRDQMSTLEILKHAAFVATLSGTVALESMCCGTPAVVFGDIYYSAFDGVAAVSSVGELEILIRNDQMRRASDASAIAALAARHLSAYQADLPWLGDPSTFAKALLRELDSRPE